VVVPAQAASRQHELVEDAYDFWGPMQTLREGSKPSLCHTRSSNARNNQPNSPDECNVRLGLLQQRLEHVQFEDVLNRQVTHMGSTW
jgi:hypothetical protein